MTLTTVAASTYLDSPAFLVSVSSSPTVAGPLKVFRQHEDGSHYRVLTDDNPNIVGSWSGYDYHAPFNQSVTYYAQAEGLTSVASSSVMLVSDDSTWLMHPSDPDLSVLVDMVAEVADFTYADRSQRYQVLGRRLPVHRTDFPRGGETGSITVMCETDQAVTAIKALLADGGPILVNTPQNTNNLGWKWVQPGDLQIKNPGGRVRYAVRMATFSYEETSQPDADTAPIWTYDELAAVAVTAYPTYADLAAAGFVDYDHFKLRIL